MSGDSVENDSPVLSLFPIMVARDMDTSVFRAPSEHPNPRDLHGDAFHGALRRLRETLPLIGFESAAWTPEESGSRLYRAIGVQPDQFLLVVEVPTLHTNSVHDYATFRRGLDSFYRGVGDSRSLEAQLKIAVYVHSRPEHPEAISARLESLRTEFLSSKEPITAFAIVEGMKADTLRKAPLELWDMEKVEGFWRTKLEQLSSNIVTP
jgi:hypothetical protein